jgi:hypothetical protein
MKKNKVAILCRIAALIRVATLDFFRIVTLLIVWWKALHVQGLCKPISKALPIDSFFKACKGVLHTGGDCKSSRTGGDCKASRTGGDCKASRTGGGGVVGGGAGDGGVGDVGKVLFRFRSNGGNLRRPFRYHVEFTTLLEELSVISSKTLPLPCRVYDARQFSVPFDSWWPIKEMQ